MVERSVQGTIGWLDRDEFMSIACGIKDGTRQLVIVLDVDEDEDTLKKRPSKPLDPSPNDALPVPDCPDIWVRTAQEDWNGEVNEISVRRNAYRRVIL